MVQKQEISTHLETAYTSSVYIDKYTCILGHIYAFQQLTRF